MTYQHKELANGRWRELTFIGQMANIGSEVERGILIKSKNKEYCVKAVERALELLDLTIDDGKNNGRLKELTRLRETLERISGSGGDEPEPGAMKRNDDRA